MQCAGLSELCTSSGKVGVVLGLTLIWWACAVGVTVILKAALVGPGSGDDSWSFPYPLTLTLFANLSTAAATGAFAAATSGGRVVDALDRVRQFFLGFMPEQSAPPQASTVFRVTSKEALLCDDGCQPALPHVEAVEMRRVAEVDDAMGQMMEDATGVPVRQSPRGFATYVPGIPLLHWCCGTNRSGRPMAPLETGSPPPSWRGSSGDVRDKEQTSALGAEQAVPGCMGSCQNRWASATSGGRLTVLAIGVLQGLALGVKNEALLLLSISTRTMIFATNVLAVMLIARLFGLEALRRTKLVSAFLLAAGGMLQGIATLEHANAQRSDTLLGWMLAILALLLDALRWVLLQAAFAAHPDLRPERGPGHLPPATAPAGGAGGAAASTSPGASRGHSDLVLSFSLVSWVMWMSTPLCLVLSLIFEPTGLRKASENPREVGMFVALLAVGVTGINLAEFGVVQSTSAVTFNVLCQLHSIPMVIAGVACFGEEVQLVQGLGFAVCLLGALLYSWARAREKHVPHTPRANEQDGRPQDNGGGAVELGDPTPPASCFSRV
mmetsp:Transcript_44104/g.133641  ORF Transcript_44104/g.133641 Transcript_44104/m.133641 type:complete len:553 (-) Transcript_44104:141-1799(-)